MFWNLLFAHFLADYPLQSNWMVRNKSRAFILAIHAAVHLAVMLLAVYPATRYVWGVLLVLTIVHYFLDMTKINLGRSFPRYVVVPYLVDQCIHYAVLLVAAWLAARVPGVPQPFLSPGLAILGTAFVFITHVWYITERVANYAQPAYVRCVVAQANGRMLARAGLLALLELALSGLGVVPGAALSSPSVLVLGMLPVPALITAPGPAPAAAALPWGLALLWAAILTFAAVQVAREAPGSWLPYREADYRRRAVLTDLAVVVAVFIFTLLAFWTL